ncbi:MAG TPA: hypothetical protein VKX96_09250 [Chloroflexota bacterium]|nr:hypothetical protein [Chloroflexota bacterium]
MERTVFGGVGVGALLFALALLLAVIALIFGSFASLAVAVILVTIAGLIEGRIVR